MSVAKKEVEEALASAASALKQASAHLCTAEVTSWDETMAGAITSLRDSTALLEEYLVQGLIPVKEKVDVRV